MGKRFSSLMDRLFSSYGFYRFLECVPGIISWTLIISPFFLARYKPHWIAYFLLAYSIFWVFNSVQFVSYAYLGHKKMLYVQKQDWVEKLKERFPDEWGEYYYCTIIPFASESINILRPTIQTLADANFPKEKKMLLLSSEMVVPAGREICRQIVEEFKDDFAFIWTTEHELLPGELKGKAPNENHAGRILYKNIEDLGIDPAKVLLTSNDADMLNQREYIPYLLYKFLLEGEDRHKKIYQPIPTDFSDIWDANFFSRVIISIGAQWRINLQQRNNYRCTVFSFYSMSLKTLKDIGFWDVDLIPEDERTMFNAIFTFGADFKVIPLFISTSGKPVQGATMLKAFKEQYKQMRRWAWGASEFAHSFSKALQHKEVPWKVKAVPILNQLRTTSEWVLASCLPLFGASIPLIMNKEFRTTTLAYTLPVIVSTLMQIASVMLIVIIYIEWKITPKRPKNKKLWHKIFTFGQWILLPYVGFALGSIPALEAQTRLIFNKRIIYIESKKEK